MPITVSCPSCKCSLQAKDEQAGRSLKCPACRSTITVPALGAAPTPVPAPPAAQQLQAATPEWIKMVQNVAASASRGGVGAKYHAVRLFKSSLLLRTLGRALCLLLLLCLAAFIINFPLLAFSFKAMLFMLVLLIVVTLYIFFEAVCRYFASSAVKTGLLEPADEAEIKSSQDLLIFNVVVAAMVALIILIAFYWVSKIPAGPSLSEQLMEQIMRESTGGSSSPSRRW